jgi:hypothetical protein
MWAPQVEALRDLFLDMNGIALAAASTGEALASGSAWQRVEQIEVPAQLVWGAFDFAYIDARMRVQSQRLAHAQTALLDQSAHLPGLEQPEVFNAGVAGFLARLWCSSSGAFPYASRDLFAAGTACARTRRASSSLHCSPTVGVSCGTHQPAFVTMFNRICSAMRRWAAAARRSKL